MKKKSKGRIEKFNRKTQVVDLKKVQKEKQRASRVEKIQQYKNKEELQKKIDVAQKKVEKVTKKKNARKKLIVFGIILILIGVICFSSCSILKLRGETKALESEQKELKARKKEIEKELKIVNDPEYIEQQARKQLQLVMPGETLYILPDKDKEKDEN